MPTEIILIRHGNAVRVGGDYVHAPLTALGQEQAAQTGRALASGLPVDAFYSSPLRRAMETAALIGSAIGQAPLQQAGIQELKPTELPGLVLLEALSILDPVEDYLDDHAGKPITWPVEGRVAAVLLDLIPRHPNQRVGIVCHSGIISAVLAWFFPEKRWHWWRTTVGNCSLTRFQVALPRAEILAVDDVTHLAPGTATTQPPARAVQIAKTTHPTGKPLQPGPRPPVQS